MKVSTKDGNELAGRRDPWDYLLALLLVLCVGRLWLMPLPSSFWTDEFATTFLVRYGPSHPSFAVAPQVPHSIYYWLPQGVDALFGFSEVAYRLPSVLLMGMTLFLVARLARRLIHPRAAWFAVFACLAMPGFNFQAANAKYHALGACIGAASFVFLIRWLDSARWRYALLYLLFAALLWRVHLLYWPLYIVFAFYSLVRLIRSETSVKWIHLAAVFSMLSLALLPVVFNALALLPEARAHVVVPLPTFADLLRELQLWLIMLLGFCALLWGAVHLEKSERAACRPSLDSWIFILGFWLILPLCLFGYSLLTGISIFVDRYMLVGLPAAALLTSALVGLFLPVKNWKGAAAILAAGLLLILGGWRTLWPLHASQEDWRAAAQRVNEIAVDPDMPVVFPSPYIEAQPPTWRPDYPLPDWLYAPLSVYPISGKPLLFPIIRSSEAELFATHLSSETLSRSRQFLIYGGKSQTQFWRKWFARKPEFARWTHRSLGPFGSIDVVLFEKGPAHVLTSSSGAAWVEKHPR